MHRRAVEDGSSADGAQATFEDAFQSYYGLVVAYALRRVGDRATADEIAQSVYEYAWRNWNRHQDDSATRVWLLSICRRQLSNHFRSSKRYLSVLSRFAADSRLSAEPRPDEEPDEVVFLREAFRRLKPRQQEVLRLVGWDQLPHAEAAALLGCSLNAFDIRLHRARAALRKEFEAIASSSPKSQGNEQIGIRDL